MRRLYEHFFPYLIALFPALFPLYLFRGNLSGIPVTLPEVLLAFALLFFVVREGAWRPRWWRAHWPLWRFWPVLLFMVAAGLSVLIVPELSTMADGTEFEARTRALGILKGWIVAPMAYFVMARFYFHQKPSLIPVALRAMVLGGVVLSLQALQQVWTGDFLTPDGRASGPFESANYLSLYVGPLLVYSVLASVKKENTPWVRVALILASLVLAAGLYFSQSYAAWLAVLGALTLGALLVLRGRGPKVFWGGLAVVLMLGASLVLSQLGTEKFEQFFHLHERSSSSVRLQVYRISADLLLDHSILGIGLGQYEQQYQVRAVEVLGHEPLEWVMLHPHNIGLSFWLNLGLAGLVAMAVLLWRSLGWLAETDARQRRIVALMFVAILFHGLFDTPYFKNDLAFQWWLLLAILL